MNRLAVRLARYFALTVPLVSMACARATVSGAGDSENRTPPGTGEVHVLLVNDVYVTDTLRNGRGSLARVAALRDSLERAKGARVLFVLAGDVLSPSVLGKWYAGAQMVDAFNAARLDYAALGNHEFDLTRPQLLARIEESRFLWMSANCRDATTRQPFARTRGWDTTTVNGVRVGLFTSTVVAAYPSYVACSDADSATTAVVDTLGMVGAQLVIGLTHRYIHEDSLTLMNEPRIAAIVGGHEHDGRRAVVNGKLLVKAQSNSRTAAFVTFTRENGRFVVRDTLFEIGRGMREDAATQAVTRRWNDSLVNRIGPERILGNSSEPINAVDSVSRGGESRFGNLVADGLRTGTRADVALINSGALRFDDIIAPGPVTNHMIEGVFLFADETRAVTFPLSGARLREVLEHGVARGSLRSGPYPQVSGVRFSFDARRPSGDRIVGDLRRDNGAVIRASDTLRVTFVVYPTCRGGDGYRIPEATAVCAEHTAKPTAFPRSVDLVMNHLAAMGGRIVQPPVDRIRRLDRE